jgi:antitoxin CcdA
LRWLITQEKAPLSMRWRRFFWPPAKHATKRPTNLSINSDLLAKAREFDINLSATLESALADTLQHKQRERWLAENKAAIAAYNDHVETHGVFSDGLRSFSCRSRHSCRFLKLKVSGTRCSRRNWRASR